MSAEQPGSPLLELWGCLGALDKGRLLVEKLLSEGPGLWQGSFVSSHVGRTRGNGIKSSQGLKRTTSVSWVAQSVWLCDPTDYSMPGFPVHHQLPELAQSHVIELVMPSNHLILCRPLLFLPSIFPSIRIFSKESVLHILELQLQHQSF